MALNSSWPAVSITGINKPRATVNKRTLTDALTAELTVQFGHLGVDHALLGVRVLDGGVIVGHKVGLEERRADQSRYLG